MLAVSGGMVASFGIPASAETATRASAPAAAPAGAAVPAAAPVSAITVATYGKVGFTAVKKKVTLPRVDLVSRVVQRETRASRSSAGRSSTGTRTTTSSYVPPARGGVLAIAQSLLGIWYVYGGSTPAGFDCSGFTSYVFRQAGIYLPRTAAQQQRAVTRVSSPQPGDLVFFGYPAHHVGIYAGNGMMYDSPRTGMKSALRRIYTTRVTYGRP